MELTRSRERIFVQGEDGKLLAEITFPTGEDGVADINHTFVDESLRGRGVAGQPGYPAGAGRRPGAARPGQADKNLLLVRGSVV